MEALDKPIDIQKAYLDELREKEKPLLAEIDREIISRLIKDWSTGEKVIKRK